MRFLFLYRNLRVATFYCCVCKLSSKYASGLGVEIRMKHSASGSMTDSCEPEVLPPCEGSCESVLQDLYINLSNLIVESRIPGINERGYGDGCHCPPLMGPNTHKCDHAKLECQKHQRLIHHLLRAVRCDVFEIEVLMLPNCCTEPKLSERIQNKEYLLLERWSINYTSCKGQSNIEISQLLRAVRSFLHFSQISAWLSSTKGKSPTNIYYRVKPSGDGSATNFEREPEVHSFPNSKISDDLYGCVTVKYPTRTQYVPIIPCSKHPPLRGYSFRTIDDTNLCQSIPLNPQLVRQLQITCDTTQSTPITKTFVPEPATLLLTPVSLLKTFSSKVSDGNMSNRILKHSNCQTDLINTSDITLDLSKSKNIDVISKSQTAFVVCNYTENCSKVQSQENVCFRKRQLAMHLHKAGLKLRKLNTDISGPPGYEIISDSLQSSSGVHNFTSEMISSREECCDVSFQVSHSVSVASSKDTQLENNSASPDNVMTCNNRIRDHFRYLKKRKATSKRKRNDVNADQTPVLPHKKVRCDTHNSSQLFSNALSSELNQKTVSFQNIKTSHVKTVIPALVSHVSNSEFESGSTQTCIDHCVSHLNSVQDVKYNFQKKGKMESNYSSVHSNEKEKKIGHGNILSNLCSQSYIRNRKRSSQRNFNKISNHKLKSNLSLCNTFQRSMSNETVRASEFNNRKKCKTANECQYTLNEDSVVPRRVKSVANCVESKEQNFSLNSMHAEEPSELDCKLHNSTPSCCKVNLFSKRLSYKNRRNISSNSNVFSNSKSLICKNSELETSHAIEIDKFRTMIKKSSIESSKITSQGKTINGHSSSYVNSNFESPDCLRSIDFDYSYKERERNIDEACELVENKKTVNTTQNKVCKTYSKLVSRPLKTNKISKARNKSCNIANDNYRTVKDNSYHKCKYRKMYNFKCANSEHSISKKLHVGTASTKTSDDGLLYILPKTASIDISQEFSSVNNLEDNKEIPHNQSLKRQNDDNRNGILQHSGKNSKSIMISHQNDQTSTFTLYPSSNAYRTLLYHATNDNLECFPKHATKFPKARKLLINFEESILKGCLPTVSSVKGFYAEIGASGSFCPNHLTLPADVQFYELGNSNQGAAPYVAHINLRDVEYYLPKKGAVQVTLFNPSETVVKMFVLNYDLSNMPPLCHTFIRQKIFYLPVGSKEENPQKSQKWLRFIIHLRFASTKTGKIYLHKDFKIVVLNKSNDDAASEFSQEPRELRSFLSVPMNPTFSSI